MSEGRATCPTFAFFWELSMRQDISPIGIADTGTYFEGHPNEVIVNNLIKYV
jgi:hypothetical protein